jgi:hypothetical protein
LRAGPVVEMSCETKREKRIQKEERMVSDAQKKKKKKKRIFCHWFFRLTASIAERQLKRTDFFVFFFTTILKIQADG